MLYTGQFHFKRGSHKWKGAIFSLHLSDDIKVYFLIHQYVHIDHFRYVRNA